MNVDEQGHRALSYQLVESMQERGKIESLVLFTGTRIGEKTLDSSPF